MQIQSFRRVDAGAAADPAPLPGLPAQPDDAAAPSAGSAAKGSSLFEIAAATILARTAPVRAHRWFTSGVTILACGLIAIIDLHYRGAGPTIPPSAAIASPALASPLPKPPPQRDRLPVEPAVDDTALPDLAGIVGRLPDDGVAMIRQADGRTKFVHIGETVSGWTLRNLSATQAVFENRGRTVDLDLPAEDATYSM